MPTTLDHDPQEKSRRLELFAQKQACADAQVNADKIGAKITATETAIAESTAKLREQVKDIQAQIATIEKADREKLQGWKADQSELLALVATESSIDEQIRRHVPSWLREERYKLSQQVNSMVQRRESLKYVNGLDELDRKKEEEAIEAEAASLTAKFARIDHAAATIAWPTPEDLAK